MTCSTSSSATATARRIISRRTREKRGAATARLSRSPPFFSLPWAILASTAIFSAAPPAFGSAGVANSPFGDSVAPYARKASLADDLDIYWNVGASAKRGPAKQQVLQLAVHAKAVSDNGGTAGWLGFGIAEMGGMEGADMFFYEAESGNITDAYAVVAGPPLRDDCQQDWVLVSVEAGADGLVVETERNLDTSDPQDRVLTDDSFEGSPPTRLIAAWGNETAVAYHGASRRAKGSVVLFGSGEEGQEGQGGAENDTSAGGRVASTASGAEGPDAGGAELINDKWFDVAPIDFEIPSSETTYQETCVSEAHLPEGGNFHAVSFESVVQERSERFVHHLVVRGYFNGDCDSSEDNLVYMYAWAAGTTGPFTLPADVGFRFGGGPGGFLSIEVQTHYHNPGGEVGRRDSSGVRVFYSVEPRAMDAGMITTGDPAIQMRGEPLLEGKSRYSFSCPSSCSRDYFVDESVTIVAHFLHMHTNGRSMETRQYRDGELVRRTAVGYYAFEQGGGFIAAAPGGSEVLRRGDTLVTECQYDTSGATEQPVVFGLGSRDEMCMDFITYYPAQPLPTIGWCGLNICGGRLEQIARLPDNSDFARSFGSDSCHEAKPDEVVVEFDASNTETRGGFAVSYALVFGVIAILVIVGALLPETIRKVDRAFEYAFEGPPEVR